MAEMMSGPINDQTIRQAVERATAAMRALDLDAAHVIAADAIDAGVEHPFLFKVQALWLLETGQFQEALRTFHHARALTPNDPMILNGIAGALSATGAHPEALKMLDASLQLNPELVTTNYLRGWTFEAMRDSKRARKAYERTLSLSPRHVGALAGLASVGARMHDFDLAREKAEQALALEPTQPTAATALALADIAAGVPTAAESQMRTLLKSPISQAAQAVAWGVLGDALDAQDRTDEAFDAYSSENAVLRTLHANHTAPEDLILTDLQALASNLEAMTDRWSNTVAKGVPGGAAKHVFLLGFMRSGTTLLEHVLASHPKIVSLEEVDLLAEPAQTYLSTADGLRRLQAASEEELNDVRDSYWRAVRERGLDPEAKILLDKLPLNTAKLPLIARLFPDSRVLFAVRDPRDVILSCFRRHFAIQSLTYAFLTLESTARLYDATMKIGNWSRINLPISSHLLRYEQLVDDFERQVRAVCDFIGVEWTEQFQDFAKLASTREISSLSASQVRRGLYAEGAGRWRAYASKLTPVLPILEPWIRKFGYPET